MNTTLAALADPTRRSILDRLSAGPATVGELAGPYGISQQAVSKHLAYLVRARLVKKRRAGRQHICTIRPEPLREVSEWMEQYRQMWEQRLDRLDNYLHTLQEKDRKDDGNRK